MDICADNALSLSVFRKNLRSAAIDVDRLMNDDPHLARELSQECLNLLQLGAVPPLPITTFPYRDYGEALRLMSTGQQTGKLVLQARSTASAEPLAVADLRPYLDPEATYLATGAFGGFGRLLLPYLATAGARHITLLDRDPQRRRSDDWLRKTSATCLSLAEAIMQGDQTGDEDDAEAEDAGAEHTIAEPAPAHRVPSAFASTAADHFRNGTAPEAGRNAAPAGAGALDCHSGRLTGDA